MSRSTSFSLLRVSGLLSLVSAVAFVACAGSDVPERTGEGIGTGGTQTASNGGSASTNAGSGGTGDGEGGSGMPSAGSGGAAGSDSSSAGGTGGGGDECDAPAILVTSCGSSGCHGGTIGTFAQDASSIMAAVGQAATLSASCGSGVLIDADDYTQGVIYNKISGTTCGSQMPLGPALSAADLTCIEDFLTDLEE